MTTRALPIGFALALATSASAPAARASAATTAVQRPAGAAGTVVVPDKFLRRWDPLTVFFERALGPAQGGPEDAPERLVRMTPAQPGAFRWLDARTLQFRPAEPWPALTRFDFQVEGQGTRLSTLMAAPLRMLPAENALGLEPVTEITLVFPEPLDAGALERMASIELRPLPGVGSGGARVLGHDDFTVKTLERRSRADEAGYVLVLRQPIPLGTRALVRLRLALEDQESVSFRELAFATAEPFRVLALGCRARQFPLTPQGTRYPREQAIACDGDTRSVIVEFSATPGALGPVEARNLVRFTPAVPELSFELQGRTLQVSGRFDADTLYGVALVPTKLSDSSGRPLELRGKSELYLHFPRKAAYLQWHKSQGIVERLGPQLVPIEGRGRTRLDLRVQRVDPLDRSFWPFPDRPVAVDESQRPPGPGEEPKPHSDPNRYPSANELAQQVLSLGTPLVSTLVELPLHREGSGNYFQMPGKDPYTVTLQIRKPGAARAIEARFDLKR